MATEGKWTFLVVTSGIALGEIEPHLVPEDADGPCPSAVLLRRAGREDVAHEVLVGRGVWPVGYEVIGHGTLDDSDRGGKVDQRVRNERQVVRTGVFEPSSTTTQPSNSSNRQGAFMGTTVVPSVSTRKLPQSAASSPPLVSQSW